MMISHHDAITVYSVESALLEQIEERARFGFSNDFIGFKNLYNVNSYADFYSWLHEGLVPLLFTELTATWEYSEGWNYTLLPEEMWTTTPRPEGYRDSRRVFPSHRGMVAFYNRLLGGIRLSQERRGEYAEDCDSDSMLHKAYGKKCTGGVRYELDPDPFDGRRTSERSRVRWLWEHDNASTTNTSLEEMERDGWLDPLTQKVEIGIATYNGEHNLHTWITINFFF